jgi:hypothetical protein
MVQVTHGRVSPRQEAWSKLAETLGMSIGDKLNSHYFNKEIDDLTNNEDLKNAPLSKKWDAMQKVAGKYGEKGQQWLKNNFEIAKLEQEEKQAELKKKEDTASAKLKHERELELEKEKGHQRRKTERTKGQFKAPPGGASFQPVPKEINDTIQRIEKENPDATADELENLYESSNVPQGYIKTKIETKRRNDEATRKEQVQFHESSKKYVDEIREGSSRAFKQREAIKDLTSSVDKVKPFSLYNVFKKMGPVGEMVANGFKSAAEGQFDAAQPLLFEGWKDVFGVRLSDTDVEIIKDKLPTLGKSEESNKAIMNIIDKYARFAQLKQKASEEVLKEKGVKTQHGLLRPLGFEDEVENRYEKLVNQFNEGKFDELPSASDYPKDTEIIDHETGQRLVSDGKNWIKKK